MLSQKQLLTITDQMKITNVLDKEIISVRKIAKNYLTFESNI